MTDASSGRKVALIRSPAGNLADAYLTHSDRPSVDSSLANQQWAAYVRAFQQSGWRTIEIPAAPELPDSVFVEDAVMTFGDTAIIGRPEATTRRPEVIEVEPVMRELGYTVVPITAPGTLEGGDVLTIGSTVYVGLGGDTNSEGIRQLTAIVEPLGYSVVTVPVTRVGHLGSSVAALPDGTVIGYPEVMEYPELFEGFIEAPEASGCGVVVLDDHTVLMAASAPLTAAMLEDRGYRVVTVDISEFEKVEACIACLSARIA